MYVVEGTHDDWIRLCSGTFKVLAVVVGPVVGPVVGLVVGLVVVVVVGEGIGVGLGSWTPPGPVTGPTGLVVDVVSIGPVGPTRATDGEDTPVVRFCVEVIVGPRVTVCMIVVAEGVMIFVGLRTVYPGPVGGGPVPVQIAVTSIHPSLSAPVDRRTEVDTMWVVDTTTVVVDVGLSDVGSESPYVGVGAGAVIQVVIVNVVAPQSKPDEPELDVLEIGVLEVGILEVGVLEPPEREFDELEINIELEVVVVIETSEEVVG